MCKRILYYLFLVFIIASPSNVWGKAINLKDIILNCGHTFPCKKVEKNFEKLPGQYSSESELMEVIRELLADLSFDTFSYELLGERLEKTIKINIVLKKYVKEIVIYTNNEINDGFFLKDSLQTKEDFSLYAENLTQDILLIKNRTSAKGYPKNEVQVIEEFIEDGVVRVVFKINLNEPKKLSKISYNCSSVAVNNLLKNALNDFINKPFDRDFFQQSVGNIKKSINDLGYFHAEFNLKLHESRFGFEAELICRNDYLVAFDLSDKTGLLSKKNIYNEVRQVFAKVDKNFLIKELTSFFEAKYLNLGHKAKVKVNFVSTSNLNGDQLDFYHVIIAMLPRQKVKSVFFRGNSFVNHKILYKEFLKNGSDLAKSGYVDEAYFQNFAELMKKIYAEKGFLSPSIYYLLRKENSKEFDHQLKAPVEIYSLIFDINEGVQTIVSNFDIEGVDFSKRVLKEAVNKYFQIKTGSPFNPVEFEKSIDDFLVNVRSLGYFYAQLNNKTDIDVTSYDKSAQEVKLKLSFSLGERIRVDKIFLIGNEKTKDFVILRKLNISHGESITPELLEKMNSVLSSLALFKSYQVKILDYEKNDAYKDIAIHVKEREFGVIEISPGFRTDLGPRLAAKISYGNLLGLNQSIALEAAANERITDTDLNPKRPNSSQSMIEYEVKANFLYPDILKSYWDYNTSLSSSRTRFYSFDADIDRYVNTFSRDLSDQVSFSLRQQLEIISQYNALKEIDEGSFRIGSLTPSITLDRRNNLAFTTKGMYLNLSSEFARPEFLSSKSDNFVINYYKLVSRNRFYFPLRQDLGVALALTVGIQENLEKDPLIINGVQAQDTQGNDLKEGFIPSIKVFRLSGVDTVRGFSEEEISKLSSGVDLTDRLIQDKVYMSNIKFEPRYLFSDDMALGIFWDAGKVQLDHFSTNEYRSSVGLSFKYLTPVGTLDVDYGHKLLRKRYGDGSIESPGRIHVSIGFF